MAVYTEVSDEELNTFIGLYDIGSVLSVKGIAEGVENSNFLLRTEAGTFILTLYEKRVKAEDLPFFISLMEHLAQHGLNCPQPVRNRSGEALGRLADRAAALVTFLEGVGINRPTVQHCGPVGEALAQLHLAGADFAGFRANALSVAGWRPLFDAAKDRADTVAPGLRDATAAALVDLEQQWPHGLPSGVIHADLFPDNVFFLNGELSGLIDFYFACNDFYAYDLAIGLNAWCFEKDGSFNMTKGRAMIAGYQSLRVLTPAEIAALPILCRGAALRFMLTRLVDWLNVPPGALVRPKDPLEYYRKLRFFQSAEKATDFGYVGGSRMSMATSEMLLNVMPRDGEEGLCPASVGDGSFPLLPVSWGEAVDKVTILEIKTCAIKNAEARRNVERELRLYMAAIAPLIETNDRLRALKAELREINQTLWNIEDRLRIMEGEQCFDDSFTALARAVYKTNDQRAAIKREINVLLGSGIIEEKCYISNPT